MQSALWNRLGFILNVLTSQSVSMKEVRSRRNGDELNEKNWGGGERYNSSPHIEFLGLVYMCIRIDQCFALLAKTDLSSSTETQYSSRFPLTQTLCFTPWVVLSSQQLNTAGYHFSLFTVSQHEAKGQTFKHLHRRNVLVCSQQNKHTAMFQASYGSGWQAGHNMPFQLKCHCGTGRGHRELIPSSA